jgi:dATP pyrophosphohydrolase
MFGLWQQVAGKVEEGETAVEAILREINEETGVFPKALYSVNTIESFYDIEHAIIMMIPAFVAILDESSEIELSHEHSEFKWLSADDAKKLLTFHLQRNSIDLICEVFVRNEPPEALRIDIP